MKVKMIGVLATRNNLRVKNARQPVKRKDILHVSVRDTKQTTDYQKIPHISSRCNPKCCLVRVQLAMISLLYLWVAARE
jgi:hypothetical protein